MSTKILFLGADRFSALSFNSFVKSCKTLGSIHILSNQLDCPLQNTAAQYPFTQCPSKSLSRFEFDFGAFDVGIVSSFALFIPPQIISQLPLINIHPSLLPRFRGPAPIQYTLLSGDKHAGVSIIDLHPEEIDAGNLLAQQEIPVPSQCNYAQLEEELAQVGGQLAARVIDNFDHFWTRKQPQSIWNVSKTRKITKEDGWIHFSKHKCLEIERKFRALAHQIPLKCSLSDDRIVFPQEPVFASLLGNDDAHFYDKATGTLFIRCADGAVGFKSFKIEGKSHVYPASAFNANFLKNKWLHFR